MKKQITFGNEKMVEGLRIAARAVASTIGPRGRNVFLADPILPRITNDGASIADKVHLADADMDAGAWVIRSATGRAADEAGDGTTTTAVLADAILTECLARPESPMIIRESLHQAMPKISAEIKKRSHKTTMEDALHIATISSEDLEMAKLITTIFKKKGVDAHVLIEDSETAQSSVELEDGYEAKVGMMSPWLVTDPQTQKATYKDVPVLCTHKKVDVIAQLLPLYEALDKKKINKLVIVCDDMNVDALATIIQNKARGTFSTLVIRATGELLDDIAAVVGATPVSEQTGVSFDSPDLLKNLGVAKNVESTYGTPTAPGITTFVGKGRTGKDKAVALERQIPNVMSDLEKKSLKKRVARLRSGVAVLKIGAYSEQDRGYLKDKADDAVKAVKAALAEGYVEGGGMCLYRIAQAMKPTTLGEDILKRALTSPLRKIIENGGQDYAEIVSSLDDKGYDAKEHRYVDLIKEGIIDPAKVERIAVESAISSIGEMITTSVLITDYVEAKD